MTGRVPEVVETMSALPLRAAILDGRRSLRPDGRPHPFQVTGSRFASRTDVERQRDTTPLSPFYFDILHLDGEDLIDRPASDRLRILRERLPRRSAFYTVAEDAQTAERFLDDALAHGHEGDGQGTRRPVRGRPPRPGWLKVKRAHTLDLVVACRRMGPRSPSGMAQQPPPGRARPGLEVPSMLGKTFEA